MPTETITITETGCYLDNHRGHYITRDVIQFAQEHGFIVGQFEQYAIDTYDDSNVYTSYPNEGLIELCNDAIEWLNSGQGECSTCNFDSPGPSWPGPGYVWESRGERVEGEWVICRACSGKGRGPRIAGQNFPPIIPAGTGWSFEDGDFGLWHHDEDGNVFDPTDN